ncbi:hypothetical protein ACQPYE_27570 [Actinosynnema sp. CA-299493]
MEIDIHHMIMIMIMIDYSVSLSITVRAARLIVSFGLLSIHASRLRERAPSGVVGCREPGIAGMADLPWSCGECFVEGRVRVLGGSVGGVTWCGPFRSSPGCRKSAMAMSRGLCAVAGRYPWRMVELIGLVGRR